MSEKEIVFVYGTLKRGGKFNGSLESQTFLGPGETVLPRPLFIGAYPYVLRTKGKVPVKGEAYEVSPECFAVLDRIEGHPGLYRREKEEIILQNGKRIVAWMYFFPEEDENRIKPSVLIPDGFFPVDPNDWVPLRRGLVYTVNAVKTFRGHDGEGYNANLLRDGKKVAIVVDLADGGETQITWLDFKEKTEIVCTSPYDGKEHRYNGSPEEKRFVEFLEKKTYVCEFDGKATRHTAGTFIESLVSGFLDKKKFDRLSKKETLFRVKGDPEGEWRTIKKPYDDKTIEDIVKNYGEQIEAIYRPS